MKLMDLTGKVFGRWTVLARERQRRGRVTYWCAQCTCGVVRYVSGTDIRRGHSKSCGCLAAELTAVREYKHGHAVSNKRGGACTPEYAAWFNALSRCYNPKNIRYARYGGRGIRFCKRWKNSFENFIADMGAKPTPGFGYSLERINNNKAYGPVNCKWASRSDQARNTSTNVFFSLDGRSQCLKAWSDELGFSPCTISARLKSGWTLREALTIPLGAYGKKSPAARKKI